MGPCLDLDALSSGTILACCSLPTTNLDGMVIALADMFLSSTADSIGTRFQYTVGRGTLYTSW